MTTTHCLAPFIAPIPLAACFASLRSGVVGGPFPVFLQITKRKHCEMFQEREIPSRLRLRRFAPKAIGPDVLILEPVS
jgi:hypothetical protein